jgi:hypothetical protein
MWSYFSPTLVFCTEKNLANLMKSGNLNAAKSSNFGIFWLERARSSDDTSEQGMPDTKNPDFWYFGRTRSQSYDLGIYNHNASAVAR